MYICGNYNSNMDFDPGPGIAMTSGAGAGCTYLLKLDANGIFQWVRTWRQQFFDISLNRIAMHPNGDLYLSGYWTGTLDFDPGAAEVIHATPDNYPDIMIIRMATDGTYVDSYRIQGAERQSINSFTQASNGDLLMTGNVAGSLDIDPGSGETLLTATGTSTDGWLARLTQNGVPVWGHAVGGADLDQLLTVVEDVFGNIHCLGSFRGEVDLDPTDGIALFDADLYWDVCLLSFDASGGFMGALHYGAGEGAQTDPNGFAAMTDGSLVLGGRALGGGDQDPGPGVEIVEGPTPTSYQPFICRVGQAQHVGLQGPHDEQHLKVYPNPARTQLFIQHPGKHVAPAKVRDVNGRMVTMVQLRPGMNTHDVSNLRPGLYTISAANFSERFVVE